MQFNFLNFQKPFISSVTLFLITVLFSVKPETAICQRTNNNVIQMVFTSDAHYALTRKKFQGDTNVNAHIVNAEMIKKINTVPMLVLPMDGGVGAGNKIGAVDYLIQTGDIANRMEIPYQSAANSWNQFETDYMHGVTLTDHNHKPAKLLLAPAITIYQML